VAGDPGGWHFVARSQPGGGRYLESQSAGLLETLEPRLSVHRNYESGIPDGAGRVNGPARFFLLHRVLLSQPTWCRRARANDEPGSRLAVRPEGLGLDAGEERRMLVIVVCS